MKKINVVIVGINHDHAHDAFTYITNSDLYNLVGIVKVEYDEYNYKKYYSEYNKYPLLSINEALNYKDLDAAIIECDESILSKYALMFLNKAIAVHMDKPGSQNNIEFKELINASKNNNAPLHLGYMYRYNPAIKEALDLYNKGLLGDIYYIEGMMNTYHDINKRKWLKNFKGGILNFLGCHIIDIITLFLGKPDDVISYSSSSINEVGEDIGTTILKYKDKFSIVNASACEYDGFSRRHITIVTSKLTIDIAPTEIYKDGKFYTKATYKMPVKYNNVPCGEVIYGPYDRYENMFIEFANIINKEIKNPYSLEHEQIVHETLLKACNIKE